MVSFFKNNLDIVGEEEVVAFIELIVAGSFVLNANPISYHTIINSHSGAGKDYLLNLIKKCMMPDKFEDYTRISSRALDYLHANQPDWDWSGKVLFLHDVDNDILNSSTMKVFMSDGSCTAIVDNGRVVKRMIKGRPVIIMSSAFSDPEFEQLRRINIINLDESANQTKRIMLHHCQNISNDVNHHKIIEKIKPVDLKNQMVEIPFAEQLIELTGCDNIYMRTFFPRLLDFIKANAVLNQAERMINPITGYLMAEPEDYENVRHSINNLSFGHNFIPISYNKKQFYSKIVENFGMEWFSIRMAESVFGLTYDAIRRSLSSLFESGYLESEIDNTSTGKPLIMYRVKEIRKMKLKSILRD
jgi:DNA-binding transcriptional ArsR family regulator